MSSPDGKQQRQLSAYAVSCHERKLAAVLEFRNTHLEIPYSCKAFRLVAKKGFQTGYPIRYADWASSCKAAASSGLLNLEESGAYALRSEGEQSRPSTYHSRPSSIPLFSCSHLSSSCLPSLRFLLPFPSTSCILSCLIEPVLFSLSCVFGSHRKNNPYALQAYISPTPLFLPSQMTLHGQCYLRTPSASPSLSPCW